MSRGAWLGQVDAMNMGYVDNKHLIGSLFDFKCRKDRHLSIYKYGQNSAVLS